MIEDPLLVVYILGVILSNVTAITCENEILQVTNYKLVTDKESYGLSNNVILLIEIDQYWWDGYTTIARKGTGKEAS